MRSDKVFHVISNTHWDREWRYPFQRNRQMLVEMIDNVLDILVNEPEYKAFHLDSQSIVLDDYLEIRPEKKEVIQKLVKAKRLLIGPWYILPDEFQVGGENLIRNLLLGHKVCSEFGGASKVGYSPFSWGQISQLPQIYAGFGIEVIMFYRGVNSLDSKYAEFLWEGADGTIALTSRFSTMPRYNFYFYIYRKVIHNEDFQDVEYSWKRNGLLFHAADAELKEDYYNLEPSDDYFAKNIRSSVEKIVADQADDFTTENVIWMEGHDSSGPNIKTVDIIRDIKKEFPGIKVLHSTLEEYAEALKKSVDYKKLDLVKGERRSSQFDRRSGNMYGYTISARMDIKQENFRTERLLQYYAEPFSSIASLLGGTEEGVYIGKAWNYLIQNSAHDSIGGCSLDEIHDDMKWRYRQCRQISEGVLSRSLQTIVKNISSPSDDKNAINITVFNPLPFSRTQVKKVFIDIPEEMDKDGFEIKDQSGDKAEHEILEKNPAEPVLEQLTDRPMYLKMSRYTCLVEFKDIPALGYKAYSVYPVKLSKVKGKKICRRVKGLPVLENDFIKVSINRNGTINFLDKQTRFGIKNTGYFYDEGEAGHAWVNKPVPPFINTLKSKPEINIIHNSILTAECKISYLMEIPANMKDRVTRKGKTVKQKIDCHIKLERNSGRIDYQIELENLAESHRLRVLFPSGIKSDYSYGEGQFDIVKRSTERPDTSSWVEQPMYDYPMHHFASVSDNEKGAAVLVEGLKEYEVLPDKGTIAITLLRCFEYVIQPSSVENYSYMKGSQCPGKHIFKLALYPYFGNNQVGILNEALRFNYELKAVQTGRTNGALPSAGSFISINSPEIIMSCFKPSEDKKGYILRLYNAADKEIKCFVNFMFLIKDAQIVSLEELPLKQMDIRKGNQFEVFLKKKEILTIKLYFS